jgi:hypothetical protein
MGERRALRPPLEGGDMHYDPLGLELQACQYPHQLAAFFTTPSSGPPHRGSLRFNDNPRAKDVATRLLIHELLGNHLPTTGEASKRKGASRFIITLINLGSLGPVVHSVRCPRALHRLRWFLRTREPLVRRWGQRFCALSIYRDDGTIVTLIVGNQVVSGLSPSTTYCFFMTRASKRCGGLSFLRVSIGTPGCDFFGAEHPRRPNPN